MNVRNARVALALGVALMVTLNGVANAQTTNNNAVKRESGATTTAKARKSSRATLPPTKASRMRVSIDARNAPVEQALERLFRDAKAEYILDNGVEGFVTLKVTNQPFENALALMLRSSTTPLTWSRDGNVYVIQPTRRPTATSVAAAPNAPGSNLEPGDPALPDVPAEELAPRARILPSGEVLTPQGIFTRPGVPVYSVGSNLGLPPTAVTLSPFAPSGATIGNTYFDPSYNTGIGPIFNNNGIYFSPPWFQTSNGFYFPYMGY